MAQGNPFEAAEDGIRTGQELAALGSGLTSGSPNSSQTNGGKPSNADQQASDKNFLISIADFFDNSVFGPVAEYMPFSMLKGLVQLLGKAISGPFRILGNLFAGNFSEMWKNLTQYLTEVGATVGVAVAGYLLVKNLTKDDKKTSTATTPTVTPTKELVTTTTVQTDTNVSVVGSGGTPVGSLYDVITETGASKVVVSDNPFLRTGSLTGSNTTLDATIQEIVTQTSQGK